MEADLKTQLTVARNEIKKLRQQLFNLKKKHDQDVKSINELLKGFRCDERIDSQNQNDLSCEPYKFRPIGYIESMYKHKNGTPRQAGVCSNASASLTISRSIFNNPEHSIEGLESFSHLWILFVFHKNHGQYTGAKIKPPRLDGAKVGLYATRCPYRPNPIGLTLARIARIDGEVIHLLGVDLLDGTPVLDIKPFIPEYDSPSGFPALRSHHLSLQSDTVCGEVLVPGSINAAQGESQQVLPASDAILATTSCSTPVCGSAVGIVGDIGKETSPICSSEPSNSLSEIKTQSSCETSLVSCADWVRNPPVSKLLVTFTPRAEDQLQEFHKREEASVDKLHLLNSEQLRLAIIDILSADPRSTYRRKHCTDRLYFVTVDTAHVTCWFDAHTVEVVKIQRLALLKSAEITCKLELV